MKKEEREARKTALARYLRYYHVGLQFFVAVGLFTWGGIVLDDYLGTVVLFTILGFALGFGGGMRALYLELYGRRDRKDRGSNGPEEDGSERKGPRQGSSASRE